MLKIFLSVDRAIRDHTVSTPDLFLFLFIHFSQISSYSNGDNESIMHGAHQVSSRDVMISAFRGLQAKKNLSSRHCSEHLYF